MFPPRTTLSETRPGGARPVPARTGTGFTLVELAIVLLVVGTIVAVALPGAFNASTGGRAAAARNAERELRLGAERAHLAWSRSANHMGFTSIAMGDGSVAWLRNGWPDAGNCCAPAGIESLIDATGYRVMHLNSFQTRLEVIAAPSPTECSATYSEAESPGDTYTVASSTSGC
jgi:type II secretory pathway pseudopilin PulG